MNEPVGKRERQPRIRHNDYTGLPVPEIGAWQPRLAVSVVIPAFDCQEKLDLTLGGLAGQTYPGHLLEVVVVDDGSSPHLRLPELAPENTRLVRSGLDGWGSAHAVRCGIAAASGDVILRLDSDMIAYREHVEAHLRWHHLADYLAVLGGLRYVDFAPGELAPCQVHDAVAGGTAEALFDPERGAPNWVEEIIDETNGLLDAGNRAYRAGSGSSISFTPRLYRECGGINTELILGGDLEFSYRLAQAGAVFVPERQARSWHLGIPQMRDRHEEGTRFREPFLSNRVPLRRDWRRDGGRQWRVPYIDVVIDARGASYKDVRAGTTAALLSTLPDVGVTLVGPWPDLTDERRTPLDDPLLDLRLIHETFAHDGRVRFAESVTETSAPTPFRFRCPAGLALTADGLRRLVDLANEERLGLVLLAFPKGRQLLIARLERTEAFARAELLCEPDEDIVEVVHEVFGTHWIDGTEWALVPAAKASTSLPKADVDKWKAQATRWRAKAEQAEQEAERWKKEAARLKAKVQAPLGEKLLDAANRRVSRIIPTSDAAKGHD
jgi:glycosyltransferase involved in cell wall biosynthesis